MITTTVYAWHRLEVRNDLRNAFEGPGGDEPLRGAAQANFEMTSEHCNKVAEIIQRFHDTRADWRRDERQPQWINWDLCIDLTEEIRLKIHEELVKNFPKIRWWNWYGYRAVTNLGEVKAHNEYVQK